MVPTGERKAHHNQINNVASRVDLRGYESAAQNQAAGRASRQLRCGSQPAGDQPRGAGRWSATIFATWSGSHGLHRTTSACCRSGLGSPVTTITGISLVAGFAARSLRIVRPSTDGRFRSSTIKDGRFSSMARSAAKPSPALTQAIPRMLSAEQ